MADYEEPTEPSKAREVLHPAIQASAHVDEDGEIHGSVSLGWVCVAEWMAPNGDRWISKLTSDATGESSAPDWQVDGYLQHALSASWGGQEVDG